MNRLTRKGPLLMMGLVGSMLPIISSSAPAAAATGDVVTTIATKADPSARNVPSVAVDSAGNPVYAYLTDSGYVVEHCTDRACADSPLSEELVAPFASRYFANAMAVEVQANGNPILAFGDDDTDSLQLVVCNDPQCAGFGDTITTIDQLPTDVDVIFLDMMLDPAGNPVFAMAFGGDNDLQGLRVLRCNDPACSGGDDKPNNIEGKGVGSSPTIKLDAANNPVIASINDATGVSADRLVRVIRCNDPLCAGLDETVVDVPGTEGALFPSMELAAGDLPVFTYSNGRSNGATRYVRCLDTTCNTVARDVELAPKANGSFSADKLPDASLELDSDGDPIIAQYANEKDVDDKTLYIYRCGDITCSSISSQNFEGREGPDSTDEFGLGTNMVLGTNDAPIISVVGLNSADGIFSGRKRDFFLVSCDDPGCDPNFTGPSSGPGTTFVSPVSPARLLDTRAGQQTVDGAFVGEGRRAAGEVQKLDVAGRANVPSDAAAAVINVTTIGPDATGFVTVYPCDAAQPDASSLNFVSGLAIGNELVAGLDKDGDLCLFTSAGMDLAVDVVGFVPGSSGYTPVVPTRLLDTRPNGATADGVAQQGGRLAAGGEVALDVTGRGNVPAGASAVIVNITAVGASGTGFVTAHPCLTPRPGTSALNYSAGVNRGNETIAQLSADGKLCLFASEATNLTVDVVGWLPATVGYTPVAPDRFVDSRDGQATVDGQFQGGGKRTPGSEYEVKLAGRGAVPANAKSVVLNLTSVGPETVGFVTVYDCEGTRPTASSLNYVPGVNGGNEIISGLNASGELCLYTSGTSHLVVDVVGYLS